MGLADLRSGAGPPTTPSTGPTRSAGRHRGDRALPARLHRGCPPTARAHRARRRRRMRPRPAAPDTPSPVAVGVSSPSSLRESRWPSDSAGRALETAVALGIHGTCDLATLGAQAAVVSDTDIGDAMVRRYLDPVGDRRRRHVLDTRALFGWTTRHEDMTPRTHRARTRWGTDIARFEELTHVSLRDTETLVEVWWVLSATSCVRPGSDSARCSSNVRLSSAPSEHQDG